MAREDGRGTTHPGLSSTEKLFVESVIWVFGPSMVSSGPQAPVTSPRAVVPLRIRRASSLDRGVHCASRGHCKEDGPQGRSFLLSCKGL